MRERDGETEIGENRETRGGGSVRDGEGNRGRDLETAVGSGWAETEKWEMGLKHGRRVEERWGDRSRWRRGGKRRGGEKRGRVR